MVSFPRNAASAEIYGVEMDGTWKVTDALQTRLAVSYLPKAEYKDYPSAIAFSFPLTPFGLTQYSPYDASGVRLKLIGSGPESTRPSAVPSSMPQSSGSIRENAPSASTVRTSPPASPRTPTVATSPTPRR